MKSRKPYIENLFGLFVFTLWGMQTASAARLLDVYVVQDGEVIMHTFYDDGGQADAATVWRYLQTPPIMVNEEVTNLQADADDPLNAQLSGDLEIRIQHTDRVIASTRLSSLLLKREDPQSQSWFLPAAEVERTAFVAGLGPPEPFEGRGSLDGQLVTLLVAVLILFSCALLTYLLLRGPRGAAEES